jgi:hypothetical protein
MPIMCSSSTRSCGNFNYGKIVRVVAKGSSLCPAQAA